MGAKTWMAVYANADVPSTLKSKPPIDREASAKLVKRLFPNDSLAALEDGTLSFTNPPDDEVYVACFQGVSIVAAGEFGLDYPSKLPAQFLDPSLGETVYLHAMHSVVDWFAFAVWRGGKLQRSLSLSPDSGILENIGVMLPFEAPFWEGAHPAVDPEDEEAGETYPLPFHPLELGEVVLAGLFGYNLEGEMDSSLLDPEDVRIMRFKRTKASRPWWKPW